MCFSESWLTEGMDDSCVDIPSFTVFRDRDVRTGSKRKDGGLLLDVNNRCFIRGTVQSMRRSAGKMSNFL